MSNQEIKKYKAEDLNPKELEWDDAYIAAAILKNLTIDLSEEEVNKFAKDGFKAGLNVFKNMIAESKAAKTEINEFLGSIFGITGEEWGHMKLTESIKCLKKWSEVEDLEDFFGLARALM